jgi:thioredoxin-related protein
MQNLKLVVLFVWVGVFSCGEKPAVVADKTKWLTLAQVEDSLQKQQRPVLVDVYTDWCGWCKVMDRKTYANKKVSTYLQEKFYAVKIDAEGKQAITWKGKQYNFNPRYRANDLAVYLTSGQLSFPTTVIIPVNGEPQPIPGYLTPAELELIVKYFGEGHYGKQDFGTFQKGFKSNW